MVEGYLRQVSDDISGGTPRNSGQQADEARHGVVPGEYTGEDLPQNILPDRLVGFEGQLDETQCVPDGSPRHGL